VRDDAPAPDPDFELRMNARLAAEFPPRRTGGGRRIRALVTTRPQLAALGAAASLLVALLVAMSVIGSGGSPPSSSSAQSAKAPAAPGGGSGPNTSAAPADKAIAPSASGDEAGSPATPLPVPPGPAGFVGGRNRKVERSAELVLAAPKDKISQVGDQIVAVTDRYRGFVLSSSVTSAGESDSSGSFDLRIPVAGLRPALRDLSALGDVLSRTESAGDVTASFVDARTRLQELNAERRGLLRRLEKAETDRAAAAIRARLRIVNAQIESQTRALTDLRRRTSYATVAVTLETKRAGSGGGIGSGARDLRDSLVATANLALRVLGVALPIAILIALLWAGGGWVSRRRREAVLD
jgi:uncharacterized protein DUF4349